MIGLLQALCACALALFQGVAVPKNDGWVTDLAGMLSSEQERALEALCESYRLGTKHDVAVLTVPDLGNQPIERYALEVARAWKLGQVGLDDGALLVVSKNDRKIRIEALRGVEGSLTDSISGRIVRDVIAPRFKNGDFHGGIRAGVEAMHAAIGGDYAALERARPSARSLPPAVMLALFVIVMLLAARGRRRRGLAGMGGMPPLWTGAMLGRGLGGFGGGGFGGGGLGGGFSGFGGGGGARGGGASGGW